MPRVTSTLRDLAISLLVEHDVPHLAAVRDQRFAEVAALQQELDIAQRHVSAWSRLNFFQERPDELRAAALHERMETARAALAKARTDLDAALAASWQACPPIEIAQRVEAIVAHASAEPRCGRLEGFEHAVLHLLDGLAARVVELWAPEIDFDVLAGALFDDNRRAAAARSSDGKPLRSHPSLGWHPIEREELFARSAAAIDASAFASARATLDREAAEHAGVAAALERARSALSLVDQLGWSPNQERVVQYKAALNKEENDLVAASESLLHAVTSAVGCYPPLAIHLAARAAAAVLRAGLTRNESVLAPHGAIMWSAAADRRAFFLASLIELRRAADAAFPGLVALVRGRELDEAARAIRQGPYRRGGSSDDAQETETARTAEQAFFEELERRGLRSRVTRAVAHGTLLGSLDAAVAGAEQRIGIFEKLAFWSDSERERQHAQLEARQRWHREMVEALGYECIHLVDQAGETQPLLMLQRLVIYAQLTLLEVDTTSGDHSSTISCPALGKERALEAIDALLAYLSRHYGPVGDRDHIVGDVVERLRHTPPAPPPTNMPLNHAQIVDALAARLSATPFAALVDRVHNARQQYAHAVHTAQAASARITLWDSLNCLSDSPAETMHQQYSREAQLLWSSMGQDIVQVNALLDQALQCYPPGAAYYALLRVRGRVEAIHGRLAQRTTTQRIGESMVTHTHYYCVLEGKTEAVQDLRHFTMGLIRTVGTAPSASELLERWVARELDA
jgi:hypothetical protein